MKALKYVGADALMQVINAINPFANKDPYTVAKCTVVNFQIANGVAITDKGIAFVTDKMEVVSTGKIDLGQETVDLAIRPKATTGVSVGLGNLTQAVKLAGPLSSPGVAIDAKGAVKALGGLGAALATGGVSLLAQSAKEKVDAASGDDPCATARTWHLTKKS
jgi:predicted phage tail protein